MSDTTDKGKIAFYCTVLGGVASLVTILAFFGVVRFPFLPIGSTSTPAFTPQVQTSTPLRTLTTFCSALGRSDTPTANSQLTPRYLNYVQTLPSNSDPYTGCAFGSLTRSSTSQGVIYYSASITFSHQSGTQGYGTVDLIQMSDGSWRIDDINCGSSYC